MSKSISNGLSVDIPVQATHSLKLAWLGGTYTAQIISGAANVPVALATNSASDQTFGPYATAIMVRLTVSAIGRVAWDTASAPAFIPPGEQFTRQDDGIPVTLSGVGPAAAFAVDGDGDGSRVIASRVGSFATPLATLTLSGGAGVFVLPIVPTLPAGIIPPHSRVWCDFRFRRGPSTLGSMIVNVRLGTAGNATDGTVFSGSMAATASADLRVLTSAEFSSDPTRYTTGFWQAFNTAGVNIGVDRAAQINTSADMFVSADVSGGADGDTLRLISYAVRLEV